MTDETAQCIACGDRPQSHGEYCRDCAEEIWEDILNTETVERIHEITFSRYGDQSRHEHEVTVFVAAKGREEAFQKAHEVKSKQFPSWKTDQTTAIHAGSSDPGNAQFRQFLDNTQDDVYIGEGVPV